MDITKLRKIMIDYKGYKPAAEYSFKSIEEKMLLTIFNLLRVPEENVRKTVNTNQNIEEYSSVDDKDTYNMEYLKALNENVKENYKLNSFVIYVLSEAHNNWIIENQKRLDSIYNKNMYKFAPLILLDWKSVCKYLVILQPMLKALDVDIDKKKLEEQFKRDKLVFSLKNSIYSKETLLKCLQKTEKIYGQLAGEKDDKGVQIIDKLGEERIIQQIAEQLEEKTDLNLANQLIDLLKIDRNRIGSSYAKLANERNIGMYSYEENIGQRKFGIRKTAYPRLNSPISETLLEISKANIIWAPDIKRFNYTYTVMSRKNYLPDNLLFIPYEECGEEQKLIDKRNRKLEKLTKKTKNKNSAKYKEPGLITFVLLDRAKNAGDKVKNDKNGKSQNPEIIQIEISKGDIIKLGYLPEELGWEKKKYALINSKRSVLISSDRELDFEEEKQNREKNEFYQRVKFEGEASQRSNVSINNDKEEDINKLEKDR